MDTVSVRYERPLDAPLDDAFAWLTDYRDDDADRTGAIIEDRRVIEKSPDRILLEGELKTLGRRIDGRAEITLNPPDAWTAELYDTKDRPSGVYEYRLNPREEGCHLSVDYAFVAPKLKHKLMLTLSKPLIKRELDKMWEGFHQAMNEEIGPKLRS